VALEKIISLFQRNHDGDRLVRDEITPGAGWVIAGEGLATRKFDGTCCLLKGGRLFKRHELRDMYIDHYVDDRAVWACKKDVPEDFEAATDVDPKTLKQQGWVPVGMGPEDKYHIEAFQIAYHRGGLVDGTYELCGPKINGNPERCSTHTLLIHGKHYLERPHFSEPAPRTFEGLRAYLARHDIEGIVFHHPDGRMVKVKTRDFGIKRPGPSGVTHDLHDLEDVA
jgi:hypothetical protein